MKMYLGLRMECEPPAMFIVDENGQTNKAKKGRGKLKHSPDYLALRKKKKYLDGIFGIF